MAQLPVLQTTDGRIMPALSVRPVFDQNITIVYAILATLVGTFLFTIVGGTLLYMLFIMIGLSSIIAASYLYGLILIAGLVCIPPLFFEVRRKAMRRTVFHFYDRHVDFQYFKWHLERVRGRLHYRDIDDIGQHASMLQEQRGLTTINLYASSTRFRQSERFSGIRLIDLPLRDDHMTRIMEIVEEGTRQRPAPVMAQPLVIDKQDVGSVVLDVVSDVVM